MNPLPTDRKSLKLVTHCGRFAADELFSFAALGLAYHDRALDLTRSVDPAELAGVDIAFGIGSRYDPQRRHFDARRNERPLRADGVPFSTFGLIWQHLGLLAISALCPGVAFPVAMAIWRHVDADLVHAIDLQASGLPGRPRNSITEFLNELKVLLDDDDASDNAFLRAAEIAEVHLRRAIADAASRLRASGRLSDPARAPRRIGIPNCRSRCARARECRSIADPLVRAMA